MSCKLCGNHSNQDVCRRCVKCEHQHIMKWGLNWRDKKEVSNEPCPHIARFQLPNKNWLTYKCTKKKNHDESCDFGVNTEEVERIARDVAGGRN